MKKRFALFLLLGILILSLTAVAIDLPGIGNPIGGDRGKDPTLSRADARINRLHGAIDFKDDLVTNRDANALRSGVEISKNRIYVDSAQFPEMNVPARIIFYNSAQDFEHPLLVRDGYPVLDAILYKNVTDIYTDVEHFSEYTLVENTFPGTYENTTVFNGNLQLNGDAFFASKFTTNTSDSIGFFNNPGSLNNNPTYVPTGGLEGSGAYQFDATQNQSISYTETTLTATQANSTSRTISLWFNFTGDCEGSGADNCPIAGFSPQSSYSQFFYGGLEIVNSTNTPQCVAGFDSSYQAATTSAVTRNTWNHLAMTFDGDTHLLRCYLNGVNVANVTLGEQLNQGLGEPARLSFGGRSRSTQAAYFTGFLDNVYYFQRVLDPEEILELNNTASTRSFVYFPSGTYVQNYQFGNDLQRANVSAVNYTGTNFAQTVLQGQAAENVAEFSNASFINGTVSGTDWLFNTLDDRHYQFRMLFSADQASDQQANVSIVQNLTYNYDLTNAVYCGTVNDPGYYPFENDITVNGSCITISSDDVTLDGLGYSLLGNGTGQAITFNQSLDIDNTTIKNIGLISNFSAGIWSNLQTNIMSNLVVQNITFSNIVGGNHLRARITNFLIDSVTANREETQNFAMFYLQPLSTSGVVTNSVFNYSGNSAAGRAFYVSGTSSNINFTGNTFYQTQSTGPEAMVDLYDGVNNILLKDNIFTVFTRAVNVVNSSEVTLTGNDVNLYTGQPGDATVLPVLVNASTNVSLRSNLIDGGNFNQSVQIIASNGTYLYNNTFANVGDAGSVANTRWYASFSPLSYDGTSYNESGFVAIFNDENALVTSDDYPVDGVNNTQSYDLMLGWINESGLPGYPDTVIKDTFYIEAGLGFPNTCAGIESTFPGSVCDFAYAGALSNNGSTAFTFNPAFNATFSVISGYTSPPTLVEKTVESSTGSQGIILDNSCSTVWEDNQLINSTLYDLSTTECTQDYSYSNAFGGVAWDTVANLTIQKELYPGNGLYLSDNLVGVEDSTLYSNLNRTMVVLFNGLTAENQPLLYLNGVRCDDTDTCNISTYSGGQLLASVASLGNYTTLAQSTPTPTPSSTSLLSLSTLSGKLALVATAFMLVIIIGMLLGYIDLRDSGMLIAKISLIFVLVAITLAIGAALVASFI